MSLRFLFSAPIHDSVFNNDVVFYAQLHWIEWCSLQLVQ